MRVYMLWAVLTGVVAVGLFGLMLVGPEAAVGSPQVVLIRHATADQGTDAAYVRFDDCTTQRNLSSQGRLEAQGMGLNFREHGFLITRVLVSPFCRTLQTARLMNLSGIEISPAFQNLKSGRQDALTASRLDVAKMIMDSWRGPGVLVVVTHSSTIKALTGLEPQDGKFVVYGNRLAGIGAAPTLFQMAF